MQINISDQKKYPKLTQYVKHQLPKVKNIPKITHALMENGEIKKKSLNMVLSWGTLPMIKIVPMPKYQCGEFLPSSNSHEIKISQALVEAFERSDGSKHLTLLLGATILHELTHWGNDQTGRDKPGEEGNMFETAAYGMIIPCIINYPAR